MSNAKSEKQRAALEAVKLIQDHQIIGLGTGSTAFYAIMEIGNLVRSGLSIRAVPTSTQTRELAIAQQIPLVDISQVENIDITIDGADEFTSAGWLVKGGGGALLREKIVASLSDTNIIIADSSKMVKQLGRFKVPIEVIPMGLGLVQRELKLLNGQGVLRQKNGSSFVTDEGNYILDTDFGLIEDPVSLAKQLDGLVGLVEHGLFLFSTNRIFVGHPDRVDNLEINL
ncbi:ribose-5-phosphate isomerase RpiA [Dyadobacter tibetensis]|uniref:ribose-5-phosphate isomerase RpiA n=1 Tax=Dyadobacter tibetensis TaxID=1211851 RepID=UPI000470FBA4|nr:ribose-5-phosphate isomerase RpiA [Dyadobacter tibetensis]